MSRRLSIDMLFQGIHSYGIETKLAKLVYSTLVFLTCAHKHAINAHNIYTLQLFISPFVYAELLIEIDFSPLLYYL